MAGNTEYKNAWQKENKDKFLLLLPKGRKKEMQDYLKTFSPPLSINAYINNLISNDINQSSQK